MNRFKNINIVSRVLELKKRLGYKENMTDSEREALRKKGQYYQSLGIKAFILTVLMLVIVILFLLQLSFWFVYVSDVLFFCIFIWLLLIGFGGTVIGWSKEQPVPPSEIDDNEAYKTTTAQSVERLEVKPQVKQQAPPQLTQVIKIKCRACGFLNDEQNKYCGGCGQLL